MQIHEIMTENPKCVGPEASLQEIAREMRDNNYGFLPVCDNERLVGTITDRDLVVRGLAEGKGLDSLHAKDVMTEKVLYCYDDDDIQKAADSMSDQKIHRLIVLNHDKKLKGVVSMKDLSCRCHDDKLCGEVIHHICED